MLLLTNKYWLWTMETCVHHSSTPLSIWHCQIHPRRAPSFWPKLMKFSASGTRLFGALWNQTENSAGARRLLTKRSHKYLPAPEFGTRFLGKNTENTHRVVAQCWCGIKRNISFKVDAATEKDELETALLFDVFLKYLMVKISWEWNSELTSCLNWMCKCAL